MYCIDDVEIATHEWEEVVGGVGQRREGGLQARDNMYTLFVGLISEVKAVLLQTQSKRIFNFQMYVAILSSGRREDSRPGTTH